MGISNVAINTFNSAGSQSICRANKFDDQTIIESDFLTKCTTQYINGTGQTVVNGSISGLPIEIASNIANQDIFDLPNDIDAISNIVLTARMTFDLPAGVADTTPNFTNSSTAYFSDTFLLSLINKVEIKLGGLVIDTLDSDHIFARNSSEYNSDVSKLNGSTNLTHTDNIYTNINHGAASTAAVEIKNNKAEWSISIPFTGRDSKMSGAFLQAGSTTNSLVMKVYYNKFIPTVDNTPHWPLFAYADDSVGKVATNWNFSTFATVTTHNITETEKNFIRNNVVNRVLKTSESLVYRNPSALQITTPPDSEFVNLSFDISDFMCNCSHLLLSMRLPAVHSGGNNLIDQDWPKSAGSTHDGSTWTGGTVGPLLPSTNMGDFGTKRLCHEIMSEFIRQPNKAGDNNGIQAPASAGAAGLDRVYIPSTNIHGHPENWLHSVEIVIGGDRSGFIPASSLKIADLQEFGLHGTKEMGGIYVLKLADSAFSTSGIPFSRCNSIRLNLRINSAIYNTPSANLKHYSSLTNVNDAGGAALPLPKLIATACGTTVQTTVGGSISFAT